MTDASRRSRLRMDIPDALVRAARARAGFDAVDVNVVIARALGAYLTDEVDMLHRKELNATIDRPSCITPFEDQHNAHAV